MSKRLTTFDFINNSKNVHGEKYDYSLVKYINAKTKVKIICKEHGIFEQNPDNHISKNQGCPICGGTKKSNTKAFIIKAKNNHNNKYDYSLVKYINNKNKVKIICPIHGVFEQTPEKHLIGQGCPKCVNKNKTTIEIINDFKKKHGDLYDYSLVDYVNNHTKVKIICSKHGIFEQSYRKHYYQNQGCPICKESIGEKNIRKILEKYDIDYQSQKRFSDCKDKYTLPFDFYLPKYNFCIEFDGKQHFEINDFFGGEYGLKKRQKHDRIKNQYCKDNNINLLRIKYSDNIIDKLIKIQLIS